MIKLNLSSPLNLLDYGANYNKSNLYLGYVKTKGYILIQENNNTTLFNCIKSDKEPDFLYINWNEDLEEIKEAYNILNDRLSFLPKEEIADTKIDIIDELLASLSANFESNYYIKPTKIKNHIIKEFALNPVKQYDFYENYDAEPLSKDEYASTKANTYNEIETALENAIKTFNDVKHITGYNKKDIESPVITDAQFIKIFNSIIGDAFNNPLFNIKYGNGREKLNRIEAIDYLKEQFNIKGVYKNGKETLYYFNENLKYFEKLTNENLKNLIISKLGIKLLREDYNSFYNSFETTDKEYTNILVFNNILFDMDYMEELNTPICRYKREDYLAPSLIGYEDRNKNVQLLNFDMDLDYLKLYEVDPNDENITFIEKTLRKILIPKDNAADLSMFHDFLQRVGSCILGRNKYKTISIWYAPGNNGKGILKLLLELVFNRGAYSLTPKNFESTFNAPSFMNRKVILLDEFDKKDFNDMKPTLKRISSPESRLEQRGMYTSETIVLDNFANLFMFSNDLIDLKLDEIALFTRIDFLKLPNTFVSKRELNKIPNSYLIDRETENKVKADIKGLSWFITASIKAFIHMEKSNSEYMLKQTAEQTLDILLDTDYLTKFIKLYTYEDTTLIKSEYTTADEIYQQFKQYMEINDKIISDNELTIKKRIGTTIKQVYDIPGKLSKSEMYYKQGNNNASYRIKLKSFDEVNDEFKHIYLINEDVTDADLIPLSFSNDMQMVYHKIQNGINTVNLLNKALPDLDNYKIVKELLNINLIIKTTETSLLNE